MKRRQVAEDDLQTLIPTTEEVSAAGSWSGRPAPRRSLVLCAQSCSAGPRCRLPWRQRYLHPSRERFSCCHPCDWQSRRTSDGIGGGGGGVCTMFGCLSGGNGFGMGASSGCERKISRPVPLYVTSSLDLSRSKRKVGSSVWANSGCGLRAVFVAPGLTVQRRLPGDGSDVAAAGD